MIQDGQGNATLVPTGKHEPQVPVSYDIAKDVAQRKGQNGVPGDYPRATVRCLESNDGSEIPEGDFDLVDGGEMTRLKHVPENPEWLVISSVP